MITAKIGRRGQFALPRPVRRALGLREGDRVLLVPDGDRVILRPLLQTLLDLRGSVPVSGEQDFSSIRQQVLIEQAKKAAKIMRTERIFADANLFLRFLTNDIPEQAEAVEARSAGPQKANSPLPPIA
ncbi:MAG: AbrB/MazE/SpoVT family DNA-binding domain-containing protein [Anaerolineae bacterium]|jgi:AbrB family looped-hinge helix DNA binding protein|nr:AbrB/MazE/SpoVT family DNA-binding domain-containing protein [Anaerolineae bacterium]MDH7472595.1 AbrB/MazE/SpoVT family DNA-binding domain-containing protein [Anaerolineae bacterium]